MLWGDFINVRGQRVALVLKAGVVVTETENPFALRSFLISAMFFTPPTGGEERSSCVAAMRPAETKWLCPSMKPGSMVRPRKSVTTVCGSARAMISASEPTARMVSPRTASACA